MEESESDEGDEGFSVSRRSLLRSGVGVAALTEAAGCMGIDTSQIQTYSFAARPVGLTNSPDGTKYSNEANFETTVERNPDLAGVGVKVTLTNYVSVYESQVDTLGLLGSPLAKIPVADGPQNPLATRPMSEILTSELGGRLLRNAGVIEGDLAWAAGPEQVAEESATLLGHETAVKSFAGVVEGEGFVLVTATRVRDAGDVVYATTVRQAPGEAGTLVGEEGYLTRGEVAESVGRLTKLLPLVKRTGVGLGLPESNRIETDAGSPNYVRVLVRNEHEEKTLHSVGLLAEFYDEEGLFLDAQLANVSYLKPGELFEGYIPYYSDAVDAYAVDGHYSSRDLDVEPVESASVVEDELADGEVTGGVRNAGSEVIDFLSVRVTLYGESGAVVGTANRRLHEIEPGATARFEIDVLEADVAPSATVQDYAVEAVRYGNSVLTVR